MRLKAPTHAGTRRGSAALVAAALVAALSTGCGSSGSGGAGTGSRSASDFIKQVTTQFSRGQAGPLWDSLHPADQAVVTRARYMTCESNEGFGLTALKVLQTYPDTIDIAGKSSASTAVSLRVTAEDGITTATMHAVRVGGTWRWVLSAKDYASYRAGKCPSG